MKRSILLLLTLLPLPGYGVDLTARITGFANSQGSARLAMFSKSRQELFPNKGNPDYVRDSVITAGTATITLSDVPPGEYAIFVYHDSNSNNSLDHKWYGPPREAFGYYRHFTVKLVPPDFDEVSFQVTDKEMVFNISLQTF